MLWSWVLALVSWLQKEIHLWLPPSLYSLVVTFSALTKRFVIYSNILLDMCLSVQFHLKVNSDILHQIFSPGQICCVAYIKSCKIHCGCRFFPEDRLACMLYHPFIVRLKPMLFFSYGPFLVKSKSMIFFTHHPSLAGHSPSKTMFLVIPHVEVLLFVGSVHWDGWLCFMSTF